MRRTLIMALAIAGSITTATLAAEREIKIEDRLDASADTLTDMMHASDHGIPQDLALAERAMVESDRLDRVEAPQRALEAKAIHATEDDEKNTKARLLNKPGFRP